MEDKNEIVVTVDPAKLSDFGKLVAKTLEGRLNKNTKGGKKMSGGNKDREKPGYYRGEKLKPGVTQEFVERVERLSTQEVRDLVVEIQKSIDDSKIFLKTNEEIQKLVTQLDLSTYSTKETIRHLNNRTKFLIDVIKAVEPSK